MGAPHDKRTHGVLLASFGTIAAIVAIGNALATWQTNHAHAAVARGLQNAFDSVALVSRIGRDLARERQLVDVHIAVTEPADMAQAAAGIAAADRDLDLALGAYAPLVVFPDEEIAWRRLQADVVTLREPIAGVLALSSRNLDLQATQQLKLVDAAFAHVDTELARLVDINRAGGLGVVARADKKQKSAIVIANVLAMIAIALVIGVGWFATRLVMRRETQMRQYAERLEEQNRELDAFAGRVAHDLRGPLTSMSMGVSRMLMTVADEAGIGAMIKRSVGRMERLIHDLLSLSRVEAQSRGAVCDPATVAAQVRDEQASRAEATQATLRIDVEPARVRANEGLLVEALTNLTDNATKYARPGVPAAIVIRGRARDDLYELAVADNGMGMSPEEVRLAFTPFYRAKRAPKTPGTGLGLSIVKRVAEVSGGSVAIESTLGQGSTFVLRLRIARDGDVG